MVRVVLEVYNFSLKVEICFRVLGKYEVVYFYVCYVVFEGKFDFFVNFYKVDLFYFCLF